MAKPTSPPLCHCCPLSDTLKCTIKDGGGTHGAAVSRCSCPVQGGGGGGAHGAQPLQRSAHAPSRPPAHATAQVMPTSSHQPSHGCSDGGGGGGGGGATAMTGTRRETSPRGTSRGSPGGRAGYGAARGASAGAAAGVAGGGGGGAQGAVETSTASPRIVKCHGTAEHSAGPRSVRCVPPCEGPVSGRSRLSEGVAA